MCILKLNMILCACFNVDLIMLDHHACFKNCSDAQTWLFYVLDELRIFFCEIFGALELENLKLFQKSPK